jgi:hypothetical protein
MGGQAMLAANGIGTRCLAVTWHYPVHGHQTMDVGNLRVEVVKFKNVSERIVVVTLADGETNARATKFCGSAFAFMSVENEVVELSVAASTVRAVARRPPPAARERKCGC